jgi:hypothetical protein
MQRNGRADDAGAEHDGIDACHAVSKHLRRPRAKRAALLFTGLPYGGRERRGRSL